MIHGSAVTVSVLVEQARSFVERFMSGSAQAGYTELPGAGHIPLVDGAAAWPDGTRDRRCFSTSSSQPGIVQFAKEVI